MARTRAQDYDEKRLAILERSAELFSRHGYAGTSITMIAEACGVSKALIYHYYPDKEAVLYDILSEHLQHLVAVVEQARDSTVDARERIYAIAFGLLDAYRDADAHHQVQITCLKLLPDARQEVLKNHERALVRMMSDALAEALPQIRRSPVLKPLTMSAFGMLNWNYMWFREGRGMTRDQYARLVTDLLLSGADAAAGGFAGSTG
jgi:AcrR family transcriptional regulator